MSLSLADIYIVRSELVEILAKPHWNNVTSSDVASCGVHVDLPNN